MSTVRFLLALSLIMLVFIPAAFAQDEDDKAEARKLYTQGTAALREGRSQEAALLFEQAGQLNKHGAAPFAAAKAWDQAEQPERAADNYARAVEYEGLRDKDKKDAQGRLTDLERTLGIVVVTGPETLEVQLDQLTKTRPPARLHGNAGVHTLHVIRDGKIERKDVMLQAGEVVEIDVTEPIEEPKAPEPPPVVAPVAPPPPPPPPPPPSAPQTRKIIGYSAMGAGALSAGVAVVLGLQTLSARSDYEDAPSHEGYDDAVSLKTWTNVAWVGAVVLGGTGAALVFWPEGNKEKAPPADVSVAASPNGILLRGSF